MFYVNLGGEIAVTLKPEKLDRESTLLILSSCRIGSNPVRPVRGVSVNR